MTEMRTINDPQGQWRPQATGDRRYIEFHTVSWHNRSKSKEAGRPIFEPVTFIKIQHPGEHDFVDRPATPQDENEFPRQWKAYQEGRQAIPEGTRLETLFPQHPEVVEMMRHQKVFTAEQLAGLNDTQLQSLGMGGRKFQQEAKQFLSAAEKGKEFHELRAQIERHGNELKSRDDKIAALERAVAAMQQKDDGVGVPQRPVAQPQQQRRPQI